MSKRAWFRTAAWSLAIAAVSTGAYVWFTRTFQRVTHEEITGYLGEARTNPYYLMQVFLEESGYTIETLRDAPGTAPAVGILFWFSDAPLAVWWEKWVQRGNHLVVVEDPFEADEDSQGPAADMMMDGRQPIGRQYRYGDGYVTVVPLSMTLTNRLFDDPQRALNLLTALRYTDWLSHVFVFTAPRMPWFGALLAKRAWQALLLLALLLSLVLWREARGFGPRLPEPALERRSLLEHLAAVGQLAVRTRSVATLCEATRAELLKRLAARLPTVSHLEGEALATRVAQTVGLDPLTVQLALLEPATADPARWVEIARAQQTLWRIR